MARAALLGATLLAGSSGFVTAPRRPQKLPPTMAVGRAAAAASGLRRRLVPWRRRSTVPRAAAATGERKGRRGRRAAAATLAALSALWCFRGTAAAATVEGAKTLIEKTASDVGLGESLKALAIAGPRRAPPPLAASAGHDADGAPRPRPSRPFQLYGALEERPPRRRWKVPKL